MIKKTATIPLEPSRIALAASLLLLAAALIAQPIRAQELDDAALEDLVAPIALYPDDVLGIVLPASTFPLDIVRAARFLEDLEEDPTLEPDPDWDDSIVALLNYPDIVQLMNEDLDWTWELGEAVLTDQSAVLDAAQRFRSRAYAAGNLQSDDKQIVGYSDGAIEIKPANPQVVYIPVYEPREVIVYQPYPIYHYYPIGYPVYYYPYPVGYSFGIDFFWGVTSYFSVGWSSHYVHVLHHTHRTHPYYLNSYYYYTPYYPRSHVNVTVSVNNYTNVWVSRPRPGSRPRSATVATVEGRTSTVRRRTSTSEGQPGVSTSGGTLSTSRPRSPARVGESQGVGSDRRLTNNGGTAAQRSNGRAASSRPDSTRSVAAPAVTSSGTRSIRTRESSPSTFAPPQQPAGRAGTSGQPTARSRPVTPVTPVTPPPSTSRSTMTSQGTTTRRAAPSVSIPSPPPVVRSNPGTSSVARAPSSVARAPSNLGASSAARPPSNPGASGAARQPSSRGSAPIRTRP